MEGTKGEGTGDKWGARGGGPVQAALRAVLRPCPAGRA